MKISDPLYGDFEVTEPVILELLESPSVVRLKRISQFAIPAEYHELDASYSRFEHSVGVMLLLRMLHADLEEQITGLLHDVSHTAFSHLIDIIIGDGVNENYQDDRHESVILNSELPAILRKHGLNVARIASHKVDSLLEKEIPDLCADRVDYGLRDMYYLADKQVPQFLAKNLAAIDGKMIFNDRKTARTFADMFLDRQKNHWGETSKMFRWHIFSEMIKKAMLKNIVALEDFNMDDEYIIAKLKNSKDLEIEKLLTLLSARRPLSFRITENDSNLMLKKKFRFVDPLYISNGKLFRLSAEDQEFSKLIESERVRNHAGVKIHFEYDKL